jgi:putative exosortase-associated protein (TIGR04073 family)
LITFFGYDSITKKGGKDMNRYAVYALLACLILGSMSGVAFSADKEQDKVQTVHNNALLGWTEIPKAVTAVTKDTDNPFLGLTVGLLKGIANAFARTTSGIGDAVTLHNPEYKSAIKPSMVEIPDTCSK